jgi:drug/metabolite transporter (DMT)-like permease
VALGCFYRALALGPMMLVAPIASTGAVIPIGVGVAEGNAPGPVVAVGIVITLAGLLLATRSPGPAATDAVQPPGKGLALAGLAAVAFGLVLLFLGRASAEGDPLWAVVVSRGMLLVGLLGIVCLTGPGPIPGKAEARPIAAMSVLETGAVLTFAIATSLGGELGALSVLASLAPLVTVLWARHHGRERLSPVQNIGAAATLVGVLVVGVASG